jgi:hypothetical protein
MATLNQTNSPMTLALRSVAGFSFMIAFVFLSFNGLSQDNVFYYGYNDANSYVASDFIQTDDGGFLIIGDVASSMPLFENPYYGRYLVKTDPVADTLWTNYHSQSYYGNAHIMESSPTTYLAVGSVGENYICGEFGAQFPFADHIRQHYSVQGELTNGWVISPACSNTIMDMELNPQGELVFFSKAQENPEFVKDEIQYNIFLLNNSGILWQYQIFTEGDEILAGDNHYLIANSESISKYDLEGGMEWIHPIDLPTPPADFCEVENQQLVFACSGFEDEVQVVKTDLGGNEVWSETFDMQCRDIMLHSSGNYFLTGEVGTELMAMAINPNGELIWSKNYDLALSGHGIKAIETEDGIAILGYSGGFGQASQYVLILESDEELALVVEGCTDPEACNFNPEATEDDGSCCVAVCLEMHVQGGETPWELGWTMLDDDDNILAQGIPGAATGVFDVCLISPCFHIELTDLENDGWGNGLWELSDSEGNVLLEGTLIGQGPEIHYYSLDEEVGCTDESANNYNANASCDDGSCTYCDDGFDVVQLQMFDTGGNGWQGAEYLISNLDTEDLVASGTMETLSMETIALCLENGCYQIELTSGDADEEISFVLMDGDGNVMTQGGIPFDPFNFMVGLAACDVPGCTNATCNNFNPYATVDDGSCICPPDNDECVDAIAVSCGSMFNGTTINANDDEGMIGTTCGPEITAPGVWYVYNGDGSTLTASLCNSAYNTLISAYVGAPDCGTLTCITGNDDSCEDQAVIQFQTEAGFDYYILVSGNGDETGDFTLQFSCVDCDGNGPINDECSGATEIMSGQVVEGTSCCNADDPVNLCTPSNSTAYGQWFVINSGDESCSFEMSLTNVGGESVGIAIFEDIGNLGCWNLNEVACCGPVTNVCDADLNAFYSTVDNTDYYIFVYTINPAGCGSWELEIFFGVCGCMDSTAVNFDPNATTPDGSCVYDCTEPTANDDCSGALPLPCGTLELAQSFGCAEATGPTGTQCDSESGAGLWYTFTGDGAIHTIRTCTDEVLEILSNSNNEIDIYVSSDGTCDGELECATDAYTGEFVSGFDDELSFECGFYQQGLDQITFVTEVGQNYYIYVSSDNSFNQLFMLSHDCVPAITGCTAEVACNFDPAATLDDGSCDFFSCLCEMCDDDSQLPLQMHMLDEFGDGWGGASYSISDEFGTVIFSGSIDDAQWGIDIDGFEGNEEGSDFFCICGEGCFTISVVGGDWPDEMSWQLIDQFGVEIVSGEGESEESFCLDDWQAGCTDPEACNFNPLAVIEDGSCTPGGCTNPIAENYDSEATCDDGSCFVLGDLDGDGIVTTIDLLILLGELGCEPFCDADLNGDGLVTVLDLLIILGELTCC